MKILNGFFGKQKKTHLPKSTIAQFTNHFPEISWIRVHSNVVVQSLFLGLASAKMKYFFQII
jgi:hypothetical protein